MKRWALLFALLALFGAGPAQCQEMVRGMTLAADDSGSAAKGGASACMPDAKKFCSASRGNREQTVDCLIDHQNDISEACYQVLKAGTEKNRGAKACKEDAKNFCSGVQQGGGRIVDCLIDHQKDISEACYQALKSKVGDKK